ncbi:hypothetical protein NP490_22010, partial [Pectobacterium carotovorum]|nr:hypothetical protein [Pectobacterium carotovorum]
LWTILSAPGMSLAELNALPEGRYQPEGAEWFYNIGTVNTAPRASSRTSYNSGTFSLLNGHAEPPSLPRRR